MPFRLFGQKIAGKKLLRTAADVIFAKDKAQGADHPGGYPSPATQYFTNKRAAAAILSLICAALGRPFFVGTGLYEDRGADPV